MDKKRKKLEEVIAKFTYSDALSSSVSPLTSISPAAQDTADLRKCQPWDRNALLQRLRTYKAATWFGKPPALSPVVCASHGWINHARDILKCPFCGATIAFQTPLHGQGAASAAEAFAKRLSCEHDDCCPWRAATPSSPGLVAFPLAPPGPVCSTYVERIERLSALAAVPALGGKGLAKLTEGAPSQLAALMLTDRVPVAEENEDEMPAAPSEGSLALECLARRPHSLAQIVKVLALLGWDVKPLPARAKPGSAPGCIGPAYQHSECLLECSTCGSVVGLWGFEAAEGTAGMLGCSGLLGSWGAGRAQPITTLNAFTIAGGLEAMPSLPVTRSLSLPRDTPTPPPFGAGLSAAGSAPAPAPSPGPAPFGTACPPPFGANVSLAANAHRGAKLPATPSQNGAEPVAPPTPSPLGSAAAREPTTPASGGGGSGGDERPRKRARLSAPAAQYALPPEVRARLKEWGVCIVDENPLDPVLSHRAWCPWVCPDDRAGWRQVLGAVAPARAAHSAFLPAPDSAGGHTPAQGRAASTDAQLMTPSASRADSQSSPVLQAAGRLIQLASSVLRMSASISPSPRQRDSDA